MDKGVPYTYACEEEASYGVLRCRQKAARVGFSIQAG